jgi:hypothetical protein
MPFWNGRTFVLQSQGAPVDIEYIPGTMHVHSLGGHYPVIGAVVDRYGSDNW